MSIQCGDCLDGYGKNDAGACVEANTCSESNRIQEDSYNCGNCVEGFWDSSGDCITHTNCSAYHLDVSVSGTANNDATCSSECKSQYYNGDNTMADGLPVCTAKTDCSAIGMKIQNEGSATTDRTCSCIDDNEFVNSTGQCQVRDSCPENRQPKSQQVWNQNIQCDCNENYYKTDENCVQITNCTALGMKIEIEGSETSDNTCSCVSSTQFVNSTTGQCQERDVCPTGQEAREEQFWNENIRCKCPDGTMKNGNECVEGEGGVCVSCGIYGESDSCGTYGESDACGTYGESDACGLFGVC